MPTGLVNAGSACYVTASFKDRAGASVAPLSASWKAIDLETGIVLQEDTALAPAASIEITVPETVNTMVNDSRPAETRRVIVTGVLSGQPVTGYFDYMLHSLEKS